MSLPPFNPYNSRNQNPTQGQPTRPISSRYSEMDNWRAQRLIDPDPERQRSPPSLETSGRRVPRILDIPMTYRSEQRMVMSERDFERSAGFLDSRIREDTVTPPLSFSSTTRSVPSFDDTDRDGESDDESDSNSLSWLQICKIPSEGNPGKFQPSVSSHHPSTSDGRCFSGERQHNRESLSVARSYDNPTPGKQSNEVSQLQSTSDLAGVLLQRFGLEKEDLDYLLMLPEDQINSDNIDMILKQIIHMKKKTSSTQSCSDPQPSTSFFGQDEPKDTREPEMFQDDIFTRFLKPAKVMDYGHTRSYTVVGEKNENVISHETRRKNDTSSRSRSKETSGKNTTEVKTSLPIPLLESTDFSSRLTSTSRSGSLQTRNLPGRPQSQPIQASQNTPSSLITQNKNTDPSMRGLNQPALVSKKSSASFIPPEADGDAPKEPTTHADPIEPLQSQNQAPKIGFIPFIISKQIAEERKISNLSYRHYRKPGTPQVEAQDSEKSKPPNSPPGEGDGKQSSPTDDPSKTHKHPAGVAKEQVKEKPAPEELKQTSQGSKLTTDSKNTDMMRQTKSQEEALQPYSSSAERSASYAFVSKSLAPPPRRSNTEADKRHSLVKSAYSELDLKKNKVFKGVPRQSKINDYLDVTPPGFPHRCTLCNVSSNNVKELASHRKTTLHRENCKLLQREYPDWHHGKQDQR
ncbi:uncharacterized protein LOC119784398 [Cyprinodon tularosa]|uniref:uncharacterized protein LOC119784398 n=1 Tax=Cyprinodon tularosa TaxID=77115 RepID=UPI0018E24739|nr:uncharacterized protein LOC119784398 [Cyprinodon tularosa]